MARNAEDRLHIALCLAMMLHAVTFGASANIESCIWAQTSAEKTVPMTRVTSLSTVIQCGLSCLKRQGCRNFCFNSKANACYVQDPQGSRLSEGDSKCFGYKRYPGGCPVEDGYNQTGGLCLKFVKSKIANYTHAKEACQRDSGHMVMMKTEADRQKITDYADLAAWIDSVTFWVGAEMLTSSGDMVWADGTTVPDNLTLWAAGYPRSDKGKCAIWWNAQLMNFDCYYSPAFYYLCQIDI